MLGLKICLNCDNPFRPKPYRLERARFCSHRCRSTMPLSKKLDNYIVVPSGCWMWQGHICKRSGYGTIGHDGKAIRAHRASWEKHRGSIPAGIDALHKCDVRPCINPDHLFLGTDVDNVADMDAKGRRYVLRGEEHGLSLLTAEQVSEIRSRPRGYGTGIQLAEEFGISPSQVSSIRLRKAWAHE